MASSTSPEREHTAADNSHGYLSGDLQSHHLINRRTFASCQRCRNRKIKCDGDGKACNPCQKAGVECVDVVKSHREPSRKHIAELLRRIEWLEDIVRNHCIDVDLEKGPDAPLHRRYMVFLRSDKALGSPGQTRTKPLSPLRREQLESEEQQDTMDTYDDVLQQEQRLYAMRKRARSGDRDYDLVQSSAKSKDEDQLEHIRRISQIDRDTLLNLQRTRTETSVTVFSTGQPDVTTTAMPDTGEGRDPSWDMEHRDTTLLGWHEDGTRDSNRQISQSRYRPGGQSLQRNHTVHDRSIPYNALDHERDRETIYKASNNGAEPLSDPLSHEVGLISLSGSSEAQYIGPSSGFSFAKLISATVQIQQPLANDWFAQSGVATPIANTNPEAHDQLPSFPVDFSRLTQFQFEEADPSGPMPKRDVALTLCKVYFDAVHFQFPVLHQSSLLDDLQAFFDNQEQQQNGSEERFDLSVTSKFAVLMVLAIGSSITSSRRSITLSPSTFFVKAMLYLEVIMSKSSRLSMAQSLLLIAIYSLYTPRAPNTWMLSYQVMAICVDLGLHRQSQSTKSTRSRLQCEMEKRVFWSAYVLDRQLGATLGRPLGLRDEAFDIDMPLNCSERDLMTEAKLDTDLDPNRVNLITPSIVLFELYQIVTDIKLNLYRVQRAFNRFPWPIDLAGFRSHTYVVLADWLRRSRSASELGPIQIHLELGYQSTLLLLYRPSPAFSNYTDEARSRCWEASRGYLNLLGRLQKAEQLPCTYLVVHETFLCGLTMLYCILIDVDLAKAHLTRTLADIRSCSSLLLALGSVWSAAQRSRNAFDKLSDIIMARLFASTQPARIPLPNGTTNLEAASSVLHTAMRSRSEDELFSASDSLNQQREQQQQQQLDETFMAMLRNECWNLSPLAGLPLAQNTAVSSTRSIRPKAQEDLSLTLSDNMQTSYDHGGNPNDMFSDLGIEEFLEALLNQNSTNFQS